VKFYTMELLQAVREMHSCRILHCDIKPDNLLVRHPEAWDTWDTEQPATWSAAGLQLIDFGRAVDLELLPPGVAFHGDSGPGCFRCIEMQEDRQWTFHVSHSQSLPTIRTVRPSFSVYVCQNRPGNTSECRFFFSSEHIAPKKVYICSDEGGGGAVDGDDCLLPTGRHVRSGVCGALHVVWRVHSSAAPDGTLIRTEQLPR
jgi:serine/threonine protein kinase